MNYPIRTSHYKPSLSSSVYIAAHQKNWWKYLSEEQRNQALAMYPLTVVGVCMVVFGLVTSSPMYPNSPLGHYSQVDICLFMCNICYDKMPAEMMECANKGCLHKSEFEVSLFLYNLGRTCKDSPFQGNETD